MRYPLPEPTSKAQAPSLRWFSSCCKAYTCWKRTKHHRWRDVAIRCLCRLRYSQTVPFSFSCWTTYMYANNSHRLKFEQEKNWCSKLYKTSMDIHRKCQVLYWTLNLLYCILRWQVFWLVFSLLNMATLASGSNIIFKLEWLNLRSNINIIKIESLNN